MLSIELTVQPTVPAFVVREPVLRMGGVSPLLLVSLTCWPTWLCCITPPPCPLPSWPVPGWRRSCLLRRDPQHWILLSNLAPCLYCDEWGWADDKQRSLGRRSNAPPGLLGAYLWLHCFGIFHPWKCEAWREWTSTPQIPLLCPSGKREIRTGAAKGGPLKTKLMTTCLGFFVAGALHRNRVQIKAPVESLQLCDLVTPK